ncbi:MAG: PAS domain-containing sensor histidine kinase [Allomuricauda sp.]
MKDKQVRIQNTVEIIEDREDAVWSMDKNYGLTAFNQSFEERFKKEFQQDIQKGMDLRPFYKKGIFFGACGKGCEKALNRYATTSKNTIVEEDHTHVHEFSFQPYIAASGEVIGCCIWQKDITKNVENVLRLEESERKYMEAQEITDVGHWNWDMAKNEITWSDQLFRIFGQVPEEFEATYEALMKIIHPEDREAFNEDVERCIKEGIPHDIVHKIIVNGGEVKHVHQKGRVYYDYGGKPFRMSGTTQDVTKDILANHQIVQQNKELEHFIHIISHNLRGPISNLLMLSKIYEWGKDEGNDDLVKKIEHTTEKLDETIKDLNFSLSLKNATKEQFREIDLQTVMEDLDGLLSEDIANSGAKIKTNFSEAPSILGLKSYVVNILYNLVLNAIKYRAEERKPVIELTTTKTDSHVILTVSDNGIGIELTPEKEKKIFDMYGRLSSATGGKGLGLYLVKTQVEAMNGKITVSSEKEIGSTFTLYFEI